VKRWRALPAGSPLFLVPLGSEAIGSRARASRASRNSTGGSRATRAASGSRCCPCSTGASARYGRQSLALGWVGDRGRRPQADPRGRPGLFAGTWPTSASASAPSIIALIPIGAYAPRWFMKNHARERPGGAPGAF
jgi:hypothetical protein